MSGLLKKVVDFVAKRLEGPELPIDDPLDKDDMPPNWKIDIVEHPQYWVESHYVEAPESNPVVDVLTKNAVIDVMKTVHHDAVHVMFDCMRHQLKSTLGFEDGAWRAWVKDHRMCAEVILHKPEALPLVKRACENAAERIRTHGIQFTGFSVSVIKPPEATQQRATIEVPVRNVQLDIDSPLVWLVLRRNQERPIVWDKKLWLPK